MSELKPCPNPECRRIPSHEGFASGGPLFQMTCDCGTCGPWADSIATATAAWNALPRAPQWVAFSPEAIEPFRDKLVLIRTKRADGGQVIEAARPRLFYYGENEPIWEWSMAYSDWPCQDSDFFMELPSMQEDDNG